MLVTTFLTRFHGNLAQRMLDQLSGASPLVMFCNGANPPPDLRPHNLAGVRYWGENKNLYFAGGVNRLVELIEASWPEADCAWILNDDLEGVSPEMGERLYEVMKDAPRLAMLSPAYNSTHPPTQPHHTGGVREVSHLDGAAHMIRLEAWRKVGGYDAENFPGWGADIDWCHRARAAGYALAVDDREIVAHDWQHGTAHNDPAIKAVYQSGGWAQRLVAKHGTRALPGFGGFYG